MVLSIQINYIKDIKDFKYSNACQYIYQLLTPLKIVYMYIENMYLKLLLINYIQLLIHSIFIKFN